MEMDNYRNFILCGKTSSQKASLQVCFPAQSNLLGVNAVDVGSVHCPPWAALINHTEWYAPMTKKGHNSSHFVVEHLRLVLVGLRNEVIV